MKRNSHEPLSLHIHDDKNGLDYTLHGDYYLPDLEVRPTPPLGRWGRMVFDNLKKQHPGRYTRMLLDGTLYQYCHEIDQQAQERFDFLMDGYKRCWEITEELKAKDQMRWVGLMNNSLPAASSIMIYTSVLRLHKIWDRPYHGRVDLLIVTKCAVLQCQTSMQSCAFFYSAALKL